jgi:hypothetical protein
LDSEEGNDPWKGKIELVIVLYFLTMATCAWNWQMQVLANFFSIPASTRIHHKAYLFIMLRCSRQIWWVVSKFGKVFKGRLDHGILKNICFCI